jgi:uncharacterized protein YecT (DUF1311 family)
MRYGFMLTMALCVSVFVQPLIFGQQLPNRQSLQAQAKQVFDAEMAREKAGDCPDAQNTADFDNCFADRLTLADQSLKRYEDIIRELTDPSPQENNHPQEATPGIAGPTLTPQQHLAEFDRIEESWHHYTTVACKAAFHQFEGGTGGPSFEEQCELKLTRDHIRELDMIYGSDLHL